MTHADVFACSFRSVGLAVNTSVRNLVSEADAEILVLVMDALDEGSNDDSVVSVLKLLMTLRCVKLPLSASF